MTDAVDPAAPRTDLEGLLERIAVDPVRVAFSPDIVAAAVTIAEASPAEYEVLVTALRRHRLRVRPWEQLVKDELAARRRSAPSRRRPDWHARLLYNDQGKLRSTIANVVTVLTHAPEWQGVLAFNDFSNAILTKRRPPWAPEDAPAELGAGPWTEQDDVRMVCTLDRELGISVSPGMARQAVDNVARRSAFHPVREQLYSLKWDAKRRLDGWLATYLGANAQSSSYLANVGRWFLLSAVARVMKPGCQADHMLVLEGPQGLGKTSVARILAGDWYASIGGSFGDKDSFVVLRERWICEIGELDGMNRAETSRVKRYISDGSDTYRAPYARQAETVPRQCVFLGTTNVSDYLKDETGGRRFWPVTVGAIDLPALRRDRDLLWAEALARYDSGETWWPRDEQKPELEAEQEERFQVDPWEPRISSWLIGRQDVVSMTELLGTCIGKPPEQQGKSDQMRIGAIMRRLGWGRERSRDDGKRRYTYKRPDPMPGSSGAREQEESPTEPAGF